MSNLPTPWERYAEVYDVLLHLSPYQDMLNDALAALAVEPNQDVLDVGCGTGNFLDFLTRQTAVGRYLGIDNEPAMMAKAQEKTRGVNYQQVNIDQPLPFAQSTFDRVVSTNVLYTVTDPVFLLREMQRVLKPGGRIVITNPVPGLNDGWILKQHSGSDKPPEYWERIDKSMTEAERLIREAITDNDVAEQMIAVRRISHELAVNPVFHFFEEQDLCALVKDQGFTIINSARTYAGISALITAIKE